MSAPLPKQTFWMVTRFPEHAKSRTEPKSRFTTRNVAEAFAHKMAHDTGARFVILETVEIVYPEDRAQGGLF